MRSNPDVYRNYAVMASDYRSNTREALSVFRTSLAEKARLQDEADALGLTLQQLFELRLLGTAKPRGRGGRPRKPRSQAEELPIAG